MIILDPPGRPKVTIKFFNNGREGRSGGGSDPMRQNLHLSSLTLKMEKEERESNSAQVLELCALSRIMCVRGEKLK